MSESFSNELLRNCTLSVFNQFPDLTVQNRSEAWLENSSFLDILGEIYTQQVDTEFKVSLKEFISECLLSSQSKKPYELPMLLKAIWSLLFGAMLVVAISGNCIVLWIVLAHRRMRTVTNYFLLNLSLADLLMASMNCVFNFIFMIDSDWPFGQLYCTINNFIANVSVAASVFTLVAISFDRYIAIVRPLQHRTSRKKARIIILIVWLASCVLAAPCLIYSSISTKKYMNGKTRTVCFISWPDGVYPMSQTDYIYNIVFLILTYGVPIAVMFVCYSLMGRELCRSRSIGERTERQQESMKSKKKVVKMFVVVVTIFAVCWLPYHLFFIYSYHNNKIMATSYVQHLYLGLYWLAMSNAMVNPLIYYWLNRRFRVYFQQIICFCCFQMISGERDNLTNDKMMLKNDSQSCCRQKTLSVKWKKSTAETKFSEKKARVVSPTNLL